MNILIDADGCPVVDLTLQIAKQFGIPVVILCDTAHQIEREGAQTLVFDKGSDSVDFALVNRVKPGDVVVTQDYGLASIDFLVAILGLSNFFREDAAVTAQTMQIGNRPCRIYGEAHAEYLLLQMTGEHELQSTESEVTAIAQSAQHFLFAAIPVESWNDALSPWEAPAVWGKQGFGGKAADTLSFLTEQVIPTLKQRFPLPENVKIILGGYSLAGLFAVGIHPD